MNIFGPTLRELYLEKADTVYKRMKQRNYRLADIADQMKPDVGVGPIMKAVFALNEWSAHTIAAWHRYKWMVALEAAAKQLRK